MAKPRAKKVQKRHKSYSTGSRKIGKGGIVVQGNKRYMTIGEMISRAGDASYYKDRNSFRVSILDTIKNKEAAGIKDPIPGVVRYEGHKNKPVVVEENLANEWIELMAQGKAPLKTIKHPVGDGTLYQNGQKLLTMPKVIDMAGTKTGYFKSGATLNDAIRVDLKKADAHIKKHGSLPKGAELPLGVGTNTLNKRRTLVVDEATARDWAKRIKENKHPYKFEKRSAVPGGIINIDGKEYMTLNHIMSLAGEAAPFKDVKGLRGSIRKTLERHADLMDGDFTPVGMKIPKGVMRYPVEKPASRNSSYIVPRDVALKWVKNMKNGKHPFSKKREDPGIWKDKGGNRHYTLAHAAKKGVAPLNTMQGTITKHLDALKVLPKGVSEIDVRGRKKYVISKPLMEEWKTRYSQGTPLSKATERTRGKAHFVNSAGKKELRFGIRMGHVEKYSDGVITNSSIISAKSDGRIPNKFLGSNRLYPNMVFIDEKYLKEAIKKKKAGNAPFYKDVPVVVPNPKKPNEKFYPVTRINEVSNGHIKDAKHFDRLKSTGKIPQSEILQYSLRGRKRIAISGKFIKRIKQREKQGLEVIPSKKEVLLHGHGTNEVGTLGWAKDNKGAFKEYLKLESAIKANNRAPEEIKSLLRKRNELLDGMGISTKNNKRNPDEVIIQAIELLSSMGE